jgi:hypothetical protein
VDQAFPAVPKPHRPLKTREGACDDDARRTRFAQGLPPSFVDFMLDGYAALVDEPAPATTAVEDITGVPPRTFREWAADHADDFR